MAAISRALGSADFAGFFKVAVWATAASVTAKTAAQESKLWIFMPAPFSPSRIELTTVPAANYGRKCNVMGLC